MCEAFWLKQALIMTLMCSNIENKKGVYVANVLRTVNQHKYESQYPSLPS